MYAVENYAAVRQFVYVEGRSRREASRVFGLSRATINKMCRFSALPGYQRKYPHLPKADVGMTRAVDYNSLMQEHAA